MTSVSVETLLGTEKQIREGLLTDDGKPRTLAEALNEATEELNVRQK